MSWLFDRDNAEKAIGRINDDEDISDQEREAELIKIFAKHGVNIKFEGVIDAPIH